MSPDSKHPEEVIDMSPQAVTRRLKLASELRDLCLSLAKAKPIPKEESASGRDRTTGKP